MGKTKKNDSNDLKEAIRDADVLMRSAVQRAKQYISDQLEPKIKEEIDKSIVREDDEEEIPTRIEDEDEEEVTEEAEDEYGQTKDAEVVKKDEETLEEEDVEDLEDLEDEDEEDEDVNLESLLDELEDEDDEEETNLGDEEDLAEPNELEDFEDEEEDEEEIPSEAIKLGEAKRIIKKQAKVIKEQRKVINYQKQAIKEVNLFNKKLFYATRINTNYPLTKDQKIKIYEHFDNAETGKEVKLVYESLKTILGQKNKKRKTVNEGASKTVKSTLNSDKKLVTEGDGFARMRELAGILEG